jgi:hypothetical protein
VVRRGINGRFGEPGREGDAYTVREGGANEGAPGHLRRVGGRLVCVADGDDNVDFDDAQGGVDPVEAAYRDYARRVSREWRG